MKLTLKLTAALMLCMIVVQVLFGFTRMQRETELFEGDMRRNHAALASALASAAARLKTGNGPAEVVQIAKDASIARAGIEVTWREPHAGAGPFRDPAGAAMQPTHEVIDDPVGQGRLVTLLPIFADGKHVGSVVLTESFAAKQQYLRASILRIAANAAAITFLSALIAVLLGFWLVGYPVGLLRAAAARVGEGDLSCRVLLRGRDELALLADDVNRMTERLRDGVIRLARERQSHMATVDQLRHADRLGTVGVLASGIAHELGTPLTVMIGRAKMIESGEVTGDQAVDSARVVAQQGERMAKIIRHLLDFARQRRSNPTRVDLRHVVEQTVALLEPIAVKSGVRITMESPEAPANVMAGAVQLQQALTNVVMNGIQAMPDGGELTLSIVRERRASGEGGEERPVLGIRARDTGYGIEPDVLPRVFDPFFTTKPTGKGTGLGLSVTYGIMQECGGWIDIESTPGAGTCVTLSIPVDGDP